MTARASVLFAAIGWLALTVACSTADVSETPAPPDWESVMKAIDEAKGFIDMQFRGPAETADLPRVAKAARAAATVMAFGYGDLEDSSVQGFADYARQTESWFLQIAVEAEAGNAMLTRDVVDQGEHHCADCHKAAGV